MCRLCDTGHRLATQIEHAGYTPADALHILTGAIANVVRAADWEETLPQLIAAISDRIRDSVISEAMH